MNEAKQTVAWVAANWRQEITEDQTIAWLEVLTKLDYRVVMLAIQELRVESSFVPDFKILHDRCAIIGRRQAALGPGTAPLKCELCEDTGWERPAVISGKEAYVICRCEKRKEGDHRGGCSCLDCHYGERAKDIRRGVDGLRGPADVDELQMVPAPRFDQASF